MSFIASINALKVRIENNQPLQDFFQTNFNKSLTVKKVYKNRIEVNLDQLPFQMITRPLVERTFAGNDSKKVHSVLLYTLFLLPDDDIEKALEHFIDIDELLEEAISVKTSLQGDKAIAVIPGNSENDEGKFHPVYASVMHVMIKDR